MVVVGFASEGKQHLNEQQLQNPESIIMLDKDAAYNQQKLIDMHVDLKENPIYVEYEGARDCVDTDNGATDPYGDGCAAYNNYPSWCGGYDDDDFISGEMCCICGGGEGEADPPTCEDQGLWDCGDGQCIPNSYVCDGSSEFCNAGWGPDCANGADEGLESCGYADDCGAPPTCEDQGLWDCGDGQCIYTSWECDGYADCANGADEADCGPASCEDQGLWDCGDGQCIYTSWVCDGSTEFCNGSWPADCANGADEGLESCGYADECAPGVCEDCVYDFTAYGAECCDAAADAFGLSCAALEGNYFWDCEGCSCPLDEDGWDDHMCRTRRFR